LRKNLGPYCPRCKKLKTEDDFYHQKTGKRLKPCRECKAELHQLNKPKGSLAFRKPSKPIPKKPNPNWFAGHRKCPRCGQYVSRMAFHGYCNDCITELRSLRDKFIYSCF